MRITLENKEHSAVSHLLVACEHGQHHVVRCLIKQNVFCLKDSETGTGLQLDRSHAYYYQVQAQIQIAKAIYCDFAVWTVGEPTNSKPSPNNRGSIYMDGWFKGN